MVWGTELIYLDFSRFVVFDVITVFMAFLYLKSVILWVIFRYVRVLISLGCGICFRNMRIS